jgi:hypothetical protein
VPHPPQSHAAALQVLVADRDETLAAFSAYHALEVGSAELEGAVAEALRERPGLVRVSGKTTLFPPLAEVTHAG